MTSSEKDEKVYKAVMKKYSSAKDVLKALKYMDDLIVSTIPAEVMRKISNRTSGEISHGRMKRVIKNVMKKKVSYKLRSYNSAFDAWGRSTDADAKWLKNNRIFSKCKRAFLKFVVPRHERVGHKLINDYEKGAGTGFVSAYRIQRTRGWPAKAVHRLYSLYGNRKIPRTSKDSVAKRKRYLKGLYKKMSGKKKPAKAKKVGAPKKARKKRAVKSKFGTTKRKLAFGPAKKKKRKKKKPKFGPENLPVFGPKKKKHRKRGKYPANKPKFGPKNKPKQGPKKKV